MKRKRKLLTTLLTISMSTVLFACGSKDNAASNLDEVSSESEFYESNATPSFELLENSMTLECGTKFDTDDLSKYITTDNFDDILINIVYVEKTKSEIIKDTISESHWEYIGSVPSTYEIVFSNYNTNEELTMQLEYIDTVPPVISIINTNKLTFYKLHYIDNTVEAYDFESEVNSTPIFSENLSFDMRRGLLDIQALFNLLNAPLFKESLFTIDEPDFGHIKFSLSSTEIIEQIDLKEYTVPGTYEIELFAIDAGNNVASTFLTIEVIEDISPQDKESISQEKYDKLLADYHVQKE